MAQENVVWTDFKDKAIDKLFIESRNRVTVKFRNISDSYLASLILRYSQKTQTKTIVVTEKFEF